MKLCERNKKEIHYKTYVGRTPIKDSDGYDTGDYEVTYSSLKTARVTLTPNKGSASAEVFGSDLNYTRTMRTDNMSSDIDENTIVWIGNATTKAHDYIVVAKAEGLGNISYALRKVDVT